jgi:hypothetical protein
LLHSLLDDESLSDLNCHTTSRVKTLIFRGMGSCKYSYVRTPNH